MQYHGIEFHDTENRTGILRLGMARFIEILYVEFYFQPLFKPQEAVDWPEKWIDGKFRGAVDKLKDTIMKFDTVARYLFDNVRLASIHKDAHEMSDYKYFLKAMTDIPIYLDSLLLYLRMQADCYANIIPNLYGQKGKKHSIARDSFRGQKKWFINKCPGFDPTYAQILKEKSSWFDTLAGTTHGQGLRDILVHYRGKYQLGWTTLSTGETISFNASLQNESGYVEENLIPKLVSIVAEYFDYLESIYIHFRGLVSENVSEDFLGDIKKNSQFLKFTGGLSSSWIYPKI